MPIVTRAGLAPDGFAADPRRSVADLPEAIAAGATGPLVVDLANDVDPAELAPWLDRIALIRVAFPAMGDGRGFSIARRLRDQGYSGRLRAVGPLVADQSAAAWAVGFDEIEIPDGVAARQPEPVWATAPRASYRGRLARV